MYIKDATKIQTTLCQPYVHTYPPQTHQTIKNQNFISSSEARKTNPPSDPSRLWVVSSASMTTCNHDSFLPKKHHKTVSSL